MESAAKINYRDVEKIDITAELTGVNAEVMAVPTNARTIQVSDAETYVTAGEFILGLKKLRKKVEETFSPIKKAMDAAKKIVLDKEKEHLKPIDDAITYISKEMIEYKRIEAAEREKKERELREKAAKLAEQERLAAAMAAEAAGENKKVVDAILTEKIVAPEIKVESEAPKIKGVSFAETWEFEIVNRDLIPDEYWLVDESAIGKVVRALKDKTNIPGIRAYSVESVKGRTK